MSVSLPFASQVISDIRGPGAPAPPYPAALNADLRVLFLLREHDRTTYGNPNPSLKRQAGVVGSDFTLFS